MKSELLQARFLLLVKGVDFKQLTLSLKCRRVGMDLFHQRTSHLGPDKETGFWNCYYCIIDLIYYGFFFMSRLLVQATRFRNFVVREKDSSE